MATPNPIDIHVGKRLRFARTMQGMSQESVGAAIGVTFQQIQKYERGINCVRSTMLFELAKVLKVKITFFFEGLEGEYGDVLPGASDSGDNSFDMQIASSRETMELMRAFHRISDSQLRSKILDLVRAMADNKPML